jgi:Domain of unknown function (DUF4865)
MLAKQYAHRLPAEHAMASIRDRAATLGPGWDVTEGLAFKAFAVRERGRFGATGNLYSSIYLWRDAAKAAEFIFGERFRMVADSFGRPPIDSWLPFDARRGRATTARAIYREFVPLGDDIDLAAVRAAELARNADLAARGDTLAVASAIDAALWRLVRLTVSAAAPDPARPGTAYEVLYLARPELAALD